LFLEQLEKSYHNKTNLYITDKIINLPSELENDENLFLSIDNYINEPQDSIEINLKDIEFNIYKINLKLRSLYDFQIISIKSLLEHKNKYQSYSQLHTDELENFLFEKFLEKI